MAGTPSLSTRPHGPLKGDWASCFATHMHLDQLAMQDYLPDLDLASTHPGLMFIDDKVLTDNYPTTHGEEQICFVPFLSRGLGFPIHPFLRGIPEFHVI